MVARKLGEPDYVLILDRLADRRTHADRKVFEIERPKQRVLHAANETFNWRRPTIEPTAVSRRAPARRDERLRQKRGNRGDRPQRIFLV